MLLTRKALSTTQQSTMVLPKAPELTPHPDKFPMTEKKKKTDGDRRGVTDENLVDAAVAYLHEQAHLQKHCIDKCNRKARSCDCLQIFAKKQEPMQCSPTIQSVAKFMVEFAKKDNIKEQQPIVIEWIKHAGNIANANKHKYPLPQICDVDDDMTKVLDNAAPEIPKVCYSALLTVLGRGRDWWSTCKRHAAAGTLPKHGLTGRPSNKPVDTELQESLESFFQEISGLAEPRAARAITRQLDTLDEDEDRYLPPKFKKRALYGRFCWGRGWSNKTSANGAIHQEEREDEEWIVLQRERKPICSWMAFWRKWQNDFPKLKLSSPAADISGKCLKFDNRMKLSKKGGKKRKSPDPGLSLDCESSY